MISTRGRYAIRMLTDLAEHGGGDYIPLKEIAERQGISQKYVEKFIPTLTKAGLVEGQHGKGGGYRLTRAPEEYTIWEILRLTEVDMAPVACLSENASVSRDDRTFFRRDHIGGSDKRCGRQRIRHLRNR